MIDFDEETDNEHDKIVIDKWEERSMLQNEKLDVVIDYLEQIRQQNDTLAQNIEVRNQLIVENKDKAIKVNYELTKQNN